jgi:phage regulator Rha-like protein
MSAFLLTQIDGEPRLDSRQIAKQLGNQHKHVFALVERYSEKLKEFGSVAFLSCKTSMTEHGFSDVRSALLNEQQVLFLLALSAGTERVVQLKLRLAMALLEFRFLMACEDLEARRKEVSISGRRLALWRYQKAGAYEHVAQLKEQLKLPLDMENLRP